MNNNPNFDESGGLINLPPEVQEVIRQAQKKLAKKVASVKNKHLDVPYAGLSPNQKLDIYLPKKAENPCPTLINIHGGAFMMGSRKDAHILKMLDALDKGWAVVSVEYRLSGEAIFPAAVEDCEAAVRFLRANAEKYNLDPNKFAAIGGSAGGNLTAMVAVLSGNSQYDAPALGNMEFSSDVQAAVEQFGPTDFLKMDEQLIENGYGVPDHNFADSPESRYMGVQITQGAPEYIRKANPMSYITDTLPPLFIQHGTVDRLVPPGQSKIFYDAIKAKLGEGRATLEFLEGVDHDGAEFDTDENWAKVWNFLYGALNLADGAV